MEEELGEFEDFEWLMSLLQVLRGDLDARHLQCGQNLINTRMVLGKKGQNVKGVITTILLEIYRELLAKAIVDHNYSFSFVEHASNRRLHAYLNRDVKFISRNTAKSIVGKMYQREKESLKHALELIPSKICLTSDLWSSITSDEYMVLTAHYVDENWVLQKKILSFSNVPPPRNGAILADKLISLLKEWGIEKKIFTITLDNASYNDTLVANLKKHPSFGPCLPCNCNFFRVRCGAHILNLIVQEGLKVIDKVVHNIRESVKYVRGSDARKLRFVECLRELPFQTSKKVCQDMPTRWNSTYTMLETSLKHRSAFLHLSMIDPYYNTCPSEEEWNIAEKIARFLEPFFHITTLFSGSYYPTANLYSIVCGEFNVVLSFAIILDPRYKLQFVEFCYEKLYGNEVAVSRAKILRDKLYVIFKGYLQHSTGNSRTMAQMSSCGTPDCDTRDDLEGFDTFTSRLVGPSTSKSQLDIYLEESRLNHREHENLNVLGFWKEQCNRFPELSLMARDILSIPITTVASESAFSIGGCILGKYRSSLLPQNAEALLCSRDWLFGVPDAQDEDDRLVEDLENLCISQSDAPMDDE
ncbi:hypothetical protein RHSIM_Rhsim04G0248700 [Rhododendron simsii]|uniref:Transposase n=1 Tax=Rhododendron simsii TaxID=118357 RepID=A0A834LS73_RHOSS|nr:hypothetical protein RHSIM_Rhsim04G0248700 [Rhododendron simsii]